MRETIAQRRAREIVDYYEEHCAKCSADIIHWTGRGLYSSKSYAFGTMRGGKAYTERVFGIPQKDYRNWVVYYLCCKCAWPDLAYRDVSPAGEQVREAAA